MPPEPAAPALPLPPGRLGLPFLGETLALLRNPFGFVEERERRHGHVFKSRVLGAKVAFLAGTEGATAFYEPGNVARADAHPFPLVDLFGGVNMEMFDGPRHQALKSITLTAFDGAALTRYLPAAVDLIDQRLAGWSRASEREISASAELRKLTIEAICLNLLGLQPGSATDAICQDYAAVLQGLVSIPLPIPGTPYGRARAARDRLLATIRQRITARRAQPGEDGLSRMLAARAPDGHAITDDEAVLEVHHVVIAGFIVYALMAEAMRQLHDRRALRDACTAEVAAAVGEGPLSLDALARLDVTNRVVMEAKRIVPLVPLAFGKADRDFECEGRRVPAGWTVYLALRCCNLNSAVYRHPERFDPGRFGPGREEHLAHPLAFVPQGTGPPTSHRCLGVEYSTMLVAAFLARLTQRYRWSLPPQDFRYRWSTIPPEPRDGMRVRLRPIR